ncbi:nuclear transport factor 2 family protein [Salinimicrobium soli]|uniref:nuclear transport factor 2 family protein n=1 Tax=Salinimicrobium soli TaxID=1254399 RepID=UPI003AACCFCB
MRILKILPLMGLLLFAGACDDANERKVEEETITAEEVSNPDVISKEWEEAWNSNKPEEVRGMMTGDAVLVMNGKRWPKDSLAPWVDMASTGMRDLKMEAIHKGASGNIAYETGVFNHGIHENDTTHFTGTYTFIWERDEASDDWKVKVMDISDDMGEDEMEE